MFVGILSVVKQKETLNFWNYSFTFDLISTIFYISFIPCLFTCAVEVRSVWKKQFKYMAELTYPLFLIHVPLLPITVRGVGFCFGPLPQWVSVWMACFAAVIGSMIMLKIESICRKGFSSSR